MKISVLLLSVCFSAATFAADFGPTIMGIRLGEAIDPAGFEVTVTTNEQKQLRRRIGNNGKTSPSQMVHMSISEWLEVALDKPVGPFTTFKVHSCEWNDKSVIDRVVLSGELDVKCRRDSAMAIYDDVLASVKKKFSPVYEKIANSEMNGLSLLWYGGKDDLEMSLYMRRDKVVDIDLMFEWHPDRHPITVSKFDADELTKEQGLPEKLSARQQQNRIANEARIKAYAEYESTLSDSERESNKTLRELFEHRRRASASLGL